MPQKPTIVSVHGVWGNAAHWSKVIARRRWVTNPSALSKIPLSSLAGDVKRTQKVTQYHILWHYLWKLRWRNWISQRWRRALSTVT